MSTPLDRLERSVVVLGGVGVGKSTTIKRFVNGEFSDRYLPTVSGTYTKITRVDSKDYHLTITDTTGQDETSLLDSSYIGSTDVYVIAFSVAFRKSFEIAQSIRDKILDMSGTDWCAVVLAGNKTDLLGERQVSETEALEVAERWGAPYVETSAKENTNVEEVFTKSVLVANRSRSGGDAEGDKNLCRVM